MASPCGPNSKVRPWTRLSSQVTYQDCWIHLRSDRCRTADGKIIEPYHVLEYPDWVNLVAITKRERKLLLAREYRHGIGQIMPGLISGGLEEADSDTGLNPHEAAARRELEEETGYQGGEFSRILTSFPNPASHSNRVVSFLAWGVEQGGSSSFDREGGEFIELVRADLPEVLARIKSGEMLMQAMHVAALWSAAAAILGSKSMSHEAPSLANRLRELMAGAEREP